MNQQSEPGITAVGHKNAFTATITAISDMFSGKGQLEPMGQDERLDGRTALVTGANTGLGRAVAIQLAERGAHVCIACRAGHEDAVKDIKKASGSDAVELYKVDLADLTDVNDFCDQLKARGRSLDIVIFNAGLMPAKARRGPQGFELMFTVHFLASRLIVERLLTDGTVLPDADPRKRPRIVFVSSESHRSSEPIDFDQFGAFVDYGIRGGLAEYGRSKLHLCTYATELARRLNKGKEIEVSVHSLCPGPIASNIAREAPVWIKPLLGPIMRLLFRAPSKAAEPVMLLAGGAAFEGENGLYLHMMREKAVSTLAADPDNGRKLWDESAKLIAPYIS